MRKLLLSNDDGVHAPGLKALYEALSVHARLRVVAPDRDKSGASNSLTLTRPLRFRRSITASTASTARRPTVCIWASTGYGTRSPTW